MVWGEHYNCGLALTLVFFNLLFCSELLTPKKKTHSLFCSALLQQFQNHILAYYLFPKFVCHVVSLVVGGGEVGGMRVVII